MNSFTADQVKQYLKETAVMGETRRFRQLDRYEAHYSCRQYSHLQHDWWGQSADTAETISPDIQVPLGFHQPIYDLVVRQKRPTAPYNLCKAVVNRFTGLLFSDARKPSVVVEGDADTEDFLEGVMQQCRFWAKMREARSLGGANGAVLVTVHVRDGKFSLEVHNPKHCQVVWRDRRSLTPMAVLKCYRYLVEEAICDDRTGERNGTKIVEYLYRRIITEQDDTVYKAVKLDGQNSVEWEVESEIRHSLEFFPGTWIQNLPVIESEDGEPDCAGAWQSFDTIDRLISQMNKAVLLNLDPTLVLSVDPRMQALAGIRKGSDNALTIGQGDSAKYLEITGSGIDAGMKVYTILKQNILDVVRCVLVDPQTISGAAQSAKAIEYIYAPMLEKADDLRSQYGDLGVLPILHIIEKIARIYSNKTLQLPDGRVGRMTFDLPYRTVTVPTADGSSTTSVREKRQLGLGGYISLIWGPYFSPTEEDKQKAIGTIAAALGGGLLDQRSAIKQSSHVFGIHNDESVYEKVKAAQEDDVSMGDLGDGSVGFGDGGYSDNGSGPPAGAGGKS
jgi:hypothetical protein